jgi:hypothetical protein
MMTLIWLLALALLVSVGVHILMETAGVLRRLYGARESLRLEREILRERLDAVRQQRQRTVSSSLTWSGNRKFRVAEKIEECGDVCSFYLKPHDGKPIPAFTPGQFLTFDLAIPGQSKRVVRCYSLSDRPRAEHYRVTIRRVRGSKDGKAPAGLVSNFFHDHLKAGDLVDVRAPGGSFKLDLTRNTPVVLIAGGVGLTPMLSMMNEIVETGARRDVWLFFGARNSAEHIAKQHMEKVAREHPNVHLHVCYSRPAETDVKGRDYHHEGHVSAALFKQVLPSNNFDYYICGPGPLMESVTTGLREWGVPDERVFFEAFGPSTVKKAAAAQPHAAAAPAAAALTVQFGQSGVSKPWDASAGSLLEFAEAQGVGSIPSGCRAGSCGTCKVAIRSGKVKYLKTPSIEVEAGTCLSCCALPETDLIIEC